MTEGSEDTSYHHLYYSAHADPVLELEKLNNKPSTANQLQSPTKDEARTYPASRLDGEEDRTELLLPSHSSQTTSPPQTRLVVTKQKSCCSCCCLISVFCCLLMGFLGGLSLGILAYRHGYGGHLERLFPTNQGADTEGLLRDPGGRLKCRLRLSGQESSRIMQTCAHCLNTRVVNVSNAWYADCNGLYSLTNLTSVWDPKRVVYQRIQGGINPQDKRFIYWNSHFYGPNFYGWSIGDKRSLTQSGPFHAQGREGASNQPWLGSWGDNVTVSLSLCGSGTNQRNIRFDKQKMNELVRKNQQKLEEYNLI